jgi:hypothetical protein
MSPSPSRWRDFLPEVVAWLGLLVGLREVFALLEVGVHAQTELFNSDALFAAGLWRDLREGGHLADWHFPHATNVPDVVAWALLDLVSPSAQWAMVLFGAGQVLGVAWLTRALLVRELGGRAGLLAPAAWATVCFLLGQGRCVEALCAFKPVHHFSVALVGLAAVPLVVRALHPAGRGARVALPLLLGLMTFSDPFAVPTLWAPAVLAVALAWWKEPALRRERGALLLGIVVAGAGGTWLLARLTRDGGGMGTVKLDVMADGLVAAWRTLTALHDDPLDVVAVLGLASCGWLFVRGLRRSPVTSLEATLDLLPLTATLANEALLILTGNLSPTTQVTLLTRYTLVPFVYLVLTLCRLVGPLTNHARAGRWVSGLVAAVVVGQGAVLAWQRSGLARAPLTAYEPPALTCLEELASQVHFERGLADYWWARPMTLLNTRGLHVDEVGIDGAPRHWANGLGAHARDGETYNFIVMNHLSSGPVSARYGAPTRVLTCPGAMLWWYAPEATARLNEGLRAAP